MLHSADHGSAAPLGVVNAMRLDVAVVILFPSVPNWILRILLHGSNTIHGELLFSVHLIFFGKALLSSIDDAWKALGVWVPRYPFASNPFKCGKMTSFRRAPPSVLAGYMPQSHLGSGSFPLMPM